MLSAAGHVRQPLSTFDLRRRWQHSSWRRLRSEVRLTRSALRASVASSCVVGRRSCSAIGGGGGGGATGTTGPLAVAGRSSAAASVVSTTTSL